MVSVAGAEQSPSETELAAIVAQVARRRVVAVEVSDPSRLRAAAHRAVDLVPPWPRDHFDGAPPLAVLDLRHHRGLRSPGPRDYGRNFYNELGEHLVGLGVPRESIGFGLSAEADQLISGWSHIVRYLIIGGRPHDGWPSDRTWMYPAPAPRRPLALAAQAWRGLGSLLRPAGRPGPAPRRALQGTAAKRSAAQGRE